MSAFSTFIRTASQEEKRKVYEKVIKESCVKQRRASGIPTGEEILSAYNSQPADDRVPLSEVFDNAIALTMRICLGIDEEK